METTAADLIVPALLQMVEVSRDGMALLDHEHRLVYANPAACALLGISNEAPVGHGFLLHFPLCERTAIAEGLGSDEPARWSSVHIVGDTERAIEYEARPHATDRGPLWILALCDVTEERSERARLEEQRLKAEELREREEQYRSVFEAASDGLVIHDADGNIVEINPAYCRMLGYTREELIGQHVSILIPPEHRHLIAEGMQSIGEGDTPQARVVVLRKDGSQVQVEGHGVAFQLKGKPHFLGVTRDISERVQAEEQLREREEQYRSIFESSLDAIGIVDMEGKLAEVNGAYCEMVGYSRDELIGMPGAALVHPDKQHIVAEAMQTISEGHAVQTDLTMVRKDGTLLHVDGRAIAFTYKGKPHFLGVSRDITDRLLAEEHLREKEEQYRSVFEATTDGLGILDTEGRFVEVNPAYCKLTGYSRDELVGMHTAALIHRDYHHLIAEGMQAISEGRDVWNRSVLVRKDGTLLQIEGGGTQFTYKGEPHFLGIARDITERLEAERKRREQEEQLREREEQYRSIFEATTDGLGVLDMEGYIVEVNPAYCQMYGYSREEVIGLHAFALIPPDYHHLLADGMRSIAMGNPVRVRSAGLRKDGTSFPVDGHGTTFLFNGKPHILGVSRDITEQVRAEERVWEREEQYRSIFESSADGLGIYDQQGFLVEANPALCQMLGYSHDELIGLHVSATIHPEYHYVIAEGLERADRDVPFRRQIVLLRKDGTSFPADGGGTTFTYKGTPHELVVLRDVSERVEAEKQIREREAEYRGIFEATNDGLIIADADGYIVEANPAYCRMFGYTREEVIGLHSTALAAPESRQTIAESVQTLTAADDYYTVATALRKDGSTFFAEARATRFMYRGRPHYLSVVQDVTERVRAYELLEQRVEERTRELSTLLDVSHNVSSTLDLRPLLDLILDQLRAVVRYTGSSIALIDGDEVEIVAHQGPGGGALAPGVRIPLERMDSLSEAWRAGPFIIDDVRGDSPAAVAYRRGVDFRNPSYRYVRSFMATPLLVGERPIGYLAVSHAEPNAFTPHHTDLAMALAQQAAIAIENARLYEQATERTRELSTLLEVSHNVSSTLELQPLLDLILDQIAGVVEYAGASIALLDGEESHIVAFRGAGSATVALDVHFPLQRSALFQMWQGVGPLIIDDVRHGETPEAVAFRTDDAVMMDDSFSYVRSWMAVPMTVNDRLVGVLTLNGAEPGLYTPHQAELVLGIASQAAIAIENARLYEQAQEAAVLEERQRLSRELHDSVSQALYGIVLGAQTARTLAERDPTQIIAPLDYVVSLAQTGLAEMRALIFELRPEMLEQEGLASVLQKQAEATTARHHIRVTTVLCDEPEAPLGTKEALYRIAQEALHNAVKHAQATEVQLSLRQVGEEIVLAIQDNGKGFDTAGSFPGHLGLHSMRERAERFGGTLELTSAVGAGTAISVRIPVRPG